VRGELPDPIYDFDNDLHVGTTKKALSRLSVNKSSRELRREKVEK